MTKRKVFKSQVTENWIVVGFDFEYVLGIFPTWREAMDYVIKELSK